MDDVISLRRYFHEFPELSGKEINTSKKIKYELEKLHIEHECVGDYGVIGILRGKSAGKTIVLRADIDALPIMESTENLKGEKTSVSNITNVCHACGHDAHTAMLLASAKRLSELKDKFSGTILFCFESGEEDGSGIVDMLDKLKDKSVDAAWGIHVYSALPTGYVSVDEGPRMSGVNFFDVKIIGRGGHGSTPHKSLDPINCTVNILSNLSSILSREIDPTQTAVLTVGKLHAGSAPNIIPDSARFEGTIRYFDEDVSKQVVKSFYRIIEGITRAHNCEFEIAIKKPGIPVINDRDLSELAKESVTKSIGKEFLIHSKPWMASESMGYYLKEYKGVFAFLGIGNEEIGISAEHHNPAFDIDEKSLNNGVDVTVQFALDFLNK